jgi:hypothetical protein
MLKGRQRMEKRLLVSALFFFFLNLAPLPTGYYLLYQLPEIFSFVCKHCNCEHVHADHLCLASLGCKPRVEEVECAARSHTMKGVAESGGSRHN